MKSIIAIDPGPVQSAYAGWDGERITSFHLLENYELLHLLNIKTPGPCENLVVEQIQCFGMPVGESIFETVFWSGRFCETWGKEFHRLPRRAVKMHLCQSMRAKDSNVIQALVDRFAPLAPNKGKGRKVEPGFFYGFKRDIWQAFALAVTWWDQNKEDK
jgi:hypothetical protein